MFLFFPIIGYARIFRIIKKSEINNYPDFKLAISQENITAFNLGRYIVISKKDLNTDGGIIIPHERAHLRYKHSIDTIIWQIFRIIFWFNPFYFLLQRNLRQVHEFQADRFTINSGIDATKYQLTLIKKSIGPGRYALANSLTHCQIKKRIAMMNIKNPKRKARWKILVFIPLLTFLLLSFSKEPVNSINNIMTKIQDPVQKRKWTVKDFDTKEVTYKNGLNIVEDNPELTQSLRILMNKNSDLLINNEPVKLNMVSTYLKKIMDYDLSNKETSSHYKKISGKYYENEMMSTSEIIITADRQTNEDNYSKLLNEVGNTIISIRNKYSKSIFNSQYATLNMDQKEDIDKLIPMNVFLDPPMNINITPPRPTGSKKTVKKDDVDPPHPIVRKSQIKITSPAKIEFEKVLHDFGIIIGGEKVSTSFKFKNTGGSDLITSTGLTTTLSDSSDYYIGFNPEAPVPPGENGEIKVICGYTNTRGPINIKFRVYSNTIPEFTDLEIKAEVYQRKSKPGVLKGEVIDVNTKEPIPFATILLTQDGRQVVGGPANFNGKYLLNPVPEGKYSIEVSSIGYKTFKIEKYKISNDKVAFLNFKLTPSKIPL